MNLRAWLQQAQLPQRELARRLGYASNGFITLVVHGHRAIPLDAAPAYADALGLRTPDRERFLAECLAATLPAWVWDNWISCPAGVTTHVDHHTTAHGDAMP
jgi:transcriptional regulator with XRE-family HTH domain